MNDERYVLAKLKMMLIDRIKNSERTYEANIDIYKEVLVLLNAIEVTAVLNEDVDVIMNDRQEEDE